MPSPRSEIDILAIIYAPLHRYPSSLFQVELLAEAGASVGVIEYTRPARTGWHATEGLPESVHQSTMTSKAGGRRSFEVLDYLWFRLRVRRFISQTCPKVVVAYDTFGCFLTGRTWAGTVKPKLIWHFHELPKTLWGEDSPRILGCAERFITRHIARPNLLLFPDRGRADYVRDRLPHATPSMIVMNCPRLRPAGPGFISAEKRGRLGLSPTDRIVYFHGALGSSRGLIEAIHSIPQWPKDTVLLMVGPAEDAFLRHLLAEAESLGVGDRLTYHPPLPYEEVMALASGADVGLSLIVEKNNPTWIHSAGALNKRFEYMAAGLPQITSGGASVRALVDDHGAGLSVDASDPKAIGAAIAHLLADDARHARMKKCARRAHETRFHYEKEFTPIRERILESLLVSPS